MYPKHIITEWLLDINEKDLVFYIYKINNVTFKNIWKISQHIQKKYEKTSFYGLYMASWNKINDFCIEDINVQIVQTNEKDIQNYYYVKKKLLQELIINTIKISQKNNKIWKPIKDNVFITFKGKQINITYGNKVYDIVEVYKKLKLYCTIKSDGSIYISFYPSIFVVSLLNLSQIKNIKVGTEIVDIVNGGNIIYDKISDNYNTTIIPEINKSIKDFLNEKGVFKIVEYNNNDIDSIKKYNIKINIKEEYKEINNDKLIIGHYEDFFRKPDKNFKPKSYSFCMQCLRLSKNNYLLRKDFKEDFNIIESIDYVKDMLKNTKMFGETLIKYDINGIDLLKQNFIYHSLDTPKYIVGNNTNKENINIKNLLNTEGVIKYKSWKINVDIISFLDEEKNETIIKLVDRMEECAKNYKMNINFNKIEYLKYYNYDIIKFIKEKYKNNVINFKPSFIIFDGTNDKYQEIKKIYSKWGTSNQFINYNKLKDLNKDLNNDKILNILLGLYFKIGRYPWMLDYKFNSSCFIGIDVSHENNKHTIASVAYIINKDGIYFREIGKNVAEVDYKNGKEKISDKSMEFILNLLINECKKIDKNINHIVIHRDGFCRENEKKFFKSFFENKDIKYSIVSILKKINRKIISNDNNINKYKSTISSYLNCIDNISYMLSTNPSGNKIANPYKVHLIDTNSDYNIINAVDDIHHLTYMCFHTTLKTRLPATIFYSDKSSTCHNREYIKCDKVYQKIFQP